MKKVMAIIQARMNSQRLPGKVLAPLAGKPVLLHVIDRVKECKRVQPILIATSETAEDDPIATFCAQQKVTCYRGELNNVAKRFYNAATDYPADAFVRISADSPLIDPRLISQAIELYQQGPVDLVTNVHPRTYPPGQSVELVHRETYLRTFSKIRDAYDQEHVTPYFYKHADDFSIVHFKAPHPYPNIHLAIDTAEDMAVITRLIRAKRKDAAFGLEDIAAAYAEINRLENPS